MHPSWFKHPIINPNTCFKLGKKVNLKWARAKPIEDPKKIERQLCKHYSDNSKKDLIKSELPRHLAHHIYQNRLKQSLAIVIAAFESQELSENQKEFMRLKLLEDISECTPGFVNRVDDIILYLQEMPGIDGVLTKYRSHLVEQAFQQDELRQKSGDRIHGHTRKQFAKISSEELYLGTPYIDSNDPYVGKSKSDIIAAIKTRFNLDYTPAKIINEFWGFTNLAELTQDNQIDFNIPENHSAIVNQVNIIFERPADNPLTVYDVFLRNDAYKLTGIDWVKLNTLLLNEFQTREYFLPSPLMKQEEYVSKDKKSSVILQYLPENIDEALLIYTFVDEEGEKATQTGFVNEKYKNRNILRNIPTELRDKICNQHLTNYWQTFSNYFASLTDRFFKGSKKEKTDALDRFAWALYSNTISKKEKITSDIAKRFYNFITSADEFGISFSRLTSRQCKALLAKYTVDDLSLIFKDAKAFEQAYQYLAPAQRITIFNYLNKKKFNFLKLATSSESFKQLIHYLEKSLQKKIFAGVDLRPLIGKAQHILNTICYLDPELTLSFFNNPANKQLICSHINTTQNLALILKTAKSELHATIIDTVHKKMNFDLSDEKDILFALEYLHHDQIADRLHLAIHHVDDFCKIFSRLDAAQSANLFSRYLKERNELPAVIKNAKDFNKSLDSLNPEQSNVAFEFFASHLDINGMVRAATDLKWIITALDKDKQNRVLPFIPIPDLTKKPDDFILLFNLLDQEQCKTAIATFTPEQFADIFKNSSTLEILFRQLNKPNLDAILPTICNNPEIIKILQGSISTLLLILNTLNSEQCIKLVSTFTPEQLAKIFNNTIALKTLFRQLHKPNIDAVFPIICNNPGIVNKLQSINISMLLSTLHTLDEDKQKTILSLLNDDEISNRIKRATDLSIIKLLEKERARSILFKAIPNIRDDFQSSDNLIESMKLSGNKIPLLMNALRTASIYSNHTDFISILKKLPQKNRLEFLENIFNVNALPENNKEPVSKEKLVSYFHRCYKEINKIFSLVPVLFRTDFSKELKIKAKKLKMTDEAQWDAILQHVAKNPKSRSARALAFMYTNDVRDHENVNNCVETFHHTYQTLRNCSFWAPQRMRRKLNEQELTTAVDNFEKDGHTSGRVRAAYQIAAGVKNSRSA